MAVITNIKEHSSYRKFKAPYKAPKTDVQQEQSRFGYILDVGKTKTFDKVIRFRLRTTLNHILFIQNEAYEETISYFPVNIHGESEVWELVQELCSEYPLNDIYDLVFKGERFTIVKPLYKHGFINVGHFVLEVSFMDRQEALDEHEDRLIDGQFEEIEF